MYLGVTCGERGSTTIFEVEEALAVAERIDEEAQRLARLVFSDEDP